MRVQSLSVILAFAFSTVAQPSNIPTREASKHVGEFSTVCGKVVGSHFAARSKGQPTFLNFDEPYPREDFTAVIWGSDRAKFGNPEAEYDGRTVCLTGRISSYRGGPEIIAREASQIEVKP